MASKSQLTPKEAFELRQRAKREFNRNSYAQKLVESMWLKMILNRGGKSGK